MTPSPVLAASGGAIVAGSPATMATSRPVRALSFVEPLPGFPGHRDYLLVPADTTGALFWLQSLAPEGPRFLTVQPAVFFPDYRPVLPSVVCAEFGVADLEAAEWYCLVTVPGGDVRSATANLRAPVVLDTGTNRARQVVLTDGGHPIRRPLRR